MTPSAPNNSQSIRSAFERLAPLTDADWATITRLLRVRTVPRGAHLLQPGEVCDYLGLLTQGTLRTYNLTYEGDEQTGWLAVEGMFVTELLSFYAQKPTREHVEAIEDAEIHYITHADLEALYRDTDGMETFGRRFLEQIMIELKEHLLSQLHDPAPERYERLLRRRPEFIQRIPLKHIASFLGVAPSTLSRIRAGRVDQP